MPRVVLFSTDAALTAADVLSQTEAWNGDPLELVWVSLGPVPGTTPFNPASGWPRTEPGPPGASRPIHGWAATPAQAEGSATGPGPSPATLTRKQAEARAVGDGRRLWAAVENDEGVAAFVTGADALTAVDLGGVRAAYHLARRHQVPIATHGLVPCLVEVEARAAGRAS